MSARKVGNMWSYRGNVGKNPATGIRRQVYKGGFKTKKAAEIAKSKFIATIQREG